MTTFTASAPQAVLFDRDGTLVADVPYNGDPSLVTAMPTVTVALRMLRAALIPVGIVTNQSGIGRGLISEDQVAAVNHRIDELLGPFDVWQVCPHTAEDACSCRKPQPGMILTAARELGLEPSEIAFIGDIGADMDAAAAAGCRAVLVPTKVTKTQEVRDAPLVAPDLASAVALLFSVPGISRGVL